MTLELNQVTSQVQAMGETIAAQAKAKLQILEQAKALLKAHATAFAELEACVSKAEQVQTAVRFSWLGASPTTEALDAAFPPPPPPEQTTIIASDGSQIHPDRHGMALYYLVNVGAIVYRHGTGLPPDTVTEPQLFYSDDDLFNEQGLIVPAGVVNVKRDMAEIDILARLAPAYAQTDAPLLALIDGQLTLRTIDLPGSQQTAYEKAYLSAISSLQTDGAILAAYIDRPRSGFVLSLLHLADLTPANITEDTLRRNPFATLTDAMLFDDLPPGYRTAVFNQRAKRNIAYDRAGHRVHFFYLNTGSANAPNLVRVEVPGWAAKNPDSLNTLHATLLQQASITGGYPYVLARAHELAIISGPERDALDTMLAISLRKHGVGASVSLKQANKNALYQSK